MDVNAEYHRPEEARIILKYWFYSRLLGCVGLLFLFVTLITPNWIRIHSSLSRITLGLWSLCTNRKCRILSGHSAILDTCRIFLSLSTLCGLVAVSAALISSPILNQSKWPLITSLTTAILSLIAILLFALSVIDKITFIDEEEEIFHYAFSFSFVGGCIGCILFFISGFLFVLIKLQESAMSGQFRTEEPSSPPLKRRPKSGGMSEDGLVCAQGVM